jgi:hypothetical protein
MTVAQAAETVSRASDLLSAVLPTYGRGFEGYVQSQADRADVVIYSVRELVRVEVIPVAA